MGNIYWIQKWAKVRQDEVIRLPENFKVHDCFLNEMQEADFDFTFREIWDMYINIYGDIAEFPEIFGMPLYKEEDYNCFTKQARDSRSAVYRPFNLLYNLFISGDLSKGALIINVTKFKTINEVKNVHILFERLSDYGFFFEGLNNYKIAKENIYISYPDNPYVLTVLKHMADKAYNTKRLNDFLACHYKLLQDDISTVNYGFGPDIVADKMHTKQEKAFVYAMDTALSERGYYSEERGWNEGPGYAYYDKEREMKTKGPYHYLMLSWKTKLVLYLRIRNASKCLEYLKQCPDSVKQIFLWSDTGCINHTNGTCLKGQEYTIDGNTYWRCGCCNAPFHFNPIREDIPHYIKLVELGLEK